jgi:hypothetical protein
VTSTQRLLCRHHQQLYSLSPKLKIVQSPMSGAHYVLDAANYSREASVSVWDSTDKASNWPGEEAKQRHRLQGSQKRQSLEQRSDQWLPRG